jgi:hypothetical protein
VICGSTTTTASWNLLDAVLPAVDIFQADGIQLMQFYFFGIPLMFLVETSSGQLVGFGWGMVSEDNAFA